MSQMLVSRRHTVLSLASFLLSLASLAGLVYFIWALFSREKSSNCATQYTNVLYESIPWIGLLVAALGILLAWLALARQAKVMFPLAAIIIGSGIWLLDWSIVFPIWALACG